MTIVLGLGAALVKAISLISLRHTTLVVIITEFPSSQYFYIHIGKFLILKTS